MKITDIKVWPTRVVENRSWIFIEVNTDEGITGFGEATNSGGGGVIMVARMVELIRDTVEGADFAEGLIGQDANDIERIWQNLYRRFTTLGPRGLVTSVISGVDMALWDIKGKALGVPVYELLGGKVRDSIQLYTHVSNQADPVAAAHHARELVDMGHTALKTDPFSPEMGQHHRRYMDGRISAAGAQHGVDVMTAIREEVGPEIDLMIDAHGNFNVATAIDLCNRMTPINLTWFEEPVQPESLNALRQVKAGTDVPLCVGERLYTRYDFADVLSEGLANYIMPDICWTGGISEMRKIATLAETYYVPISPHDASGSLNVVGGAHVMMTTPNFYRLETSRPTPEEYNRVLTEPIEFIDGHLTLPDKPGLGVELDVEFMAAHPDPHWAQAGGGQ
ncbi:MAG TPA: mandelate racemase/muconate lactonizing enzyme family protein [Dehalococcoidia bacterium]|jgi:galactonate dehydratase|nr:mandelate racemase/muconate lactonizing enzyme family protein [Dehalococcoidia bacterium]